MYRLAVDQKATFDHHALTVHLFSLQPVSTANMMQLNPLGEEGNWWPASKQEPALPSFRDRIPVIVDEVATITGPSELIDVVVTERGIAINPRRVDLLDRLRNSSLPIRPIEQLKEQVG